MVNDFIFINDLLRRVGINFRSKISFVNLLNKSYKKIIRTRKPDLNTKYISKKNLKLTDAEKKNTDF
jgi:hypothetical protein